MLKVASKAKAKPIRTVERVPLMISYVFSTASAPLVAILSSMSNFFFKAESPHRSRMFLAKSSNASALDVAIPCEAILAFSS